MCKTRYIEMLNHTWVFLLNIGERPLEQKPYGINAGRIYTLTLSLNCTISLSEYFLCCSIVEAAYNMVSGTPNSLFSCHCSISSH